MCLMCTTLTTQARALSGENQFRPETREASRAIETVLEAYAPGAFVEIFLL